VTTLRVADLFAGLGGFSEGARQAGARVVWAANHWREAVDTHALNHPETQHLCQDLHQARWDEVPEHDLMLASPACQGHTRARGKERAHHDATRSSALAVLGAVDYHRPPFLLVENVPEFRQWDGYPAWCGMLRAFGYELTENVLNAADFGVPQSRERLFVMATRGGKLPLHAPGLPHVAAESFIAWDHPRWSPVLKPGRAPATWFRFRRGRRAHGERFLLAYYGSERGGRPVTEPIGTITTRDRFAVVRGREMRMLTAQECRAAMGFPAEYALPRSHKLAVHMLGNAVCPPVARELVRQVLEVA